MVGGFESLDVPASLWPTPTSTRVATLYIQGTGYALTALLGGVDLHGVTPNAVTGIAADGLTVVGCGTPMGAAPTLVSFIATIPGPSSACGLAVLLGACGSRRRRRH